MLTEKAVKRLSRANDAVQTIVAALPPDYSYFTRLGEAPRGWHRVTAALDPDGSDERYSRLLKNLLTASPEDLPGLRLDLDEVVGARLAREAETMFLLGLALGRRRSN